METLIITGDINGNDLPTHVTTPFATTPTTMTEINNRITSGGILKLENATLTIGQIDAYSNSILFFGVKTLKLINSKIITNGNVFDVFCETFEMDSDSSINGFTSNSLQANIDTLGDHGGYVNIYITNEVNGILNIDLTGQNGGNGSKGVKGATGARGYGGRGGRNGSFGTCKRGPGKGGPGRKGGKGGTGADGQNAGDGGDLNILFIEKNPTNTHNLIFISNGGNGGDGGNGGEGGEGGRRGSNGAGAGNCDSLRPPYAPNGAKGSIGNRGLSGESGQNGTAFIKKILISEL